MFDHLFAPITINGMILRNRIAVAPVHPLRSSMEDCMHA